MLCYKQFDEILRHTKKILEEPFTKLTEKYFLERHIVKLKKEHGNFIEKVSQ